MFIVFAILKGYGISYRIKFSMEHFSYAEYLASAEMEPVFPGFNDVTQLEEQNHMGPDPEVEEVALRPRRNKNFSVEEDKSIVTAWLNVGLDAAVGNQQKSASFWDRIFDMYKQSCATDQDRSKVSIEHRWGVIQELVSKFCGCYNKVQRLQRSGTTEQDKVHISRRQ